MGKTVSIDLAANRENEELIELFEQVIKMLNILWKYIIFYGTIRKNERRI